MVAVLDTALGAERPERFGLPVVQIERSSPRLLDRAPRGLRDVLAASEQKLHRPRTPDSGNLRQPHDPRRLPENRRRTVLFGSIVEFAGVDLAGLDVEAAKQVEPGSEHVRRHPKRAIEGADDAVVGAQAEHVQPECAQAPHVCDLTAREEHALRHPRCGASGLERGIRAAHDKCVGPVGLESSTVGCGAPNS